MVPEIEYKWYHNVLKIILLVFGLPFMVILMVLLMLKMVLIFSVMICSVLGSMGCIVLISWSILKAFDSEDDEAWKEQWTNVYVLGLI
jgi:predicted ferric reductase